MNPDETQLWWFYTVEPNRDGLRGPWGPLQARSVEQAVRIAKARAAGVGMTLDRVEPFELDAEEGAK